MRCEGCRTPLAAASTEPMRSISGPCGDCFRRLTDGTEAFGSPLCHTMWSFGEPLLLLPGNRVQLAFGERTSAAWTKIASLPIITSTQGA
jgi:hypothetical protein